MSAASEQDDENKKSLNVVVKADTLGSLEAIIGSLETIKNEEVSVKVVGKGLGNITADDASLAQTSSALLFGFNVSTTPVSQEMIQSNNIRFFQYRVIYDLFDKVKIDKSFNGKVSAPVNNLWFEDRGEIKIKNQSASWRTKIKIKAMPRVGVSYAGPIWSAKKWRFCATINQ